MTQGAGKSRGSASASARERPRAREGVGAREKEVGEGWGLTCRVGEDQMVEQLLLVEAEALKQRGTVHRLKTAAASIFRRCLFCVCMYLCVLWCSRVCVRACVHACVCDVIKVNADGSTCVAYGMCGAERGAKSSPPRICHARLTRQRSVSVYALAPGSWKATGVQ